MKYCLFLVFIWFIPAAIFAQQAILPAQGASVEQLNTTAEIEHYAGSARTLLVTGNGERGLFYYTKEKHSIDNGVVFKGPDKGYWVRQYDEAGPVDVAWFGAKMDSVTDDGEALKRALKYPLIRISGNLSISGKLFLPEGRTVEFTSKGSITITDTNTLRINSFIKANDYQCLFRGSRKVLFGSEAVPHVSACWFGAVADCRAFGRGKGTDNTQAIQLALNAAQKVSEVFLPPVSSAFSYRITATLTISKKLHFFSFRFRGGGTTITNSADDRASTIFADFTEGSAVNVQGSRRVYLSDFSVHGINSAPRKLGSYDTINIRPGVNDPSLFLNPGIERSYAGITTDAEKDSKIWSADVVFERLQVEGFNIGIGISQAGHYQGDRMRVENTQINECVYGISVGQAQNRACHFFNVDMNRIWCGITNTEFGDHTGSVFQVTGGQWCHVYKCFIMQPSYLGQCVISGLYTEAIGLIGDIGRYSPNNSSVIFTGCHFFMQDDGLHRGYAFTPPFYTLISYGNVTFDGCNFWAGKRYLAMLSGDESGKFTGSAITMRGCSVHKCTSMHIKGNATIENTFLIPESGTINYNRNVTVDFQRTIRYNTGYNCASVISGTESVSGETSNSEHGHTAKVSRKIPRFYADVNTKGNLSLTVWKHDTLRFSYGQQLQHFFRNVMPYDVLGTGLTNLPGTTDDNPALEILTIDTNTRMVTAMSRTLNINLDQLALYTNCFFTTQPTSGYMNYESPIVRRINHPDQLQAGDFITFNAARRTYRIRSVNLQDSSILLMDAIEEKVTGFQEIYNEQLTDSGATGTQPIRTVTGSVLLDANDYTVLANASGNDIAVRLPSYAMAGKVYNVKKVGSAHQVSIIPQSGTIDGRPSYVLTAEYQGIQVQFDGVNYVIISK